MVVKTKILLLIISFISVLVLSLSTVALAAENVPAPAPAPAAAAGTCTTNQFLGFPTWYQYLELDGDCNVVTQGKDYIPILVAMGILDIILYLAGFLSTIMIFYGGFKYLTSNGESGKITEGKNTIVGALVGLVIALIASQVVGFVAGSLG